MATGRRVSGGPGTGFVNLSDWVAANAAGGQRLADELSSGANASGLEAQSALDALESDYWRRVGEGGYGYKENGVDAARASELATRGYTGPNALSELEGYEDAMGKAQRAGERANQLGGLFSRATSLQDTYGKGRDYSSQQALLDSALAGSAGGGRFAQLGQQWGGLLGRAQAKEKDASALARETRASTAEAQAQYAALAPKLKAEEDRARAAADQAATDYMTNQQDEWERRGGVAGNERGPRSRRSAPVTSPKSRLDGWGKGGSWG